MKLVPFLHFLFVAIIGGLLIVSCNEDSPVNPSDDLPSLVRIVEVKVTRIESQNQSNEAWDPDGSMPDLYLTFSLNGGASTVITDTLFDFGGSSEGVFELKELIEISPSDDFYTIRLFDEDFNPSIPSSLQSDEEVLRFDSNPWALPFPLVNRNVVILTRPVGQIEISLEREF